jgi:hypothetical protein
MPGAPAGVYKLDDTRNAALRDDLIVVDTNIWLWLVYPNATLGLPPIHMINAYSTWIVDARNKGAVVQHTTINLMEIAYRIERDAWSVYKATLGTDVPLKTFREGADERADVIADVHAAWDQVKRLSSAGNLRLGHDDNEAILALLTSIHGDAPDMIQARYVARQSQAGKVAFMLSHDRDLAAVPDLALVTGNGGAIADARAAGRLLTR